MTSIAPVLCRACSRLNREFAKPTMPGDDERLAIRTCSAFPDGIPVSIALAGADHHAPVEGDHGLQFLMAPGAEAERALGDWLDTFVLKAS